MLNMTQPKEITLRRSKMPYRYFVKCITEECVDIFDISPKDITSSNNLDFFNVLIRVKLKQSHSVTKYWEAEGFNVISFKNEDDNTDRNLRVLLLSTIPSDQARHQIIVEYALGNHDY